MTRGTRTTLLVSTPITSRHAFVPSSDTSTGPKTKDGVRLPPLGVPNERVTHDRWKRKTRTPSPGDTKGKRCSRWKTVDLLLRTIILPLMGPGRRRSRRLENQGRQSLTSGTSRYRHCGSRRPRIEGDFSLTQRKDRGPSCLDSVYGRPPNPQHPHLTPPFTTDSFRREGKGTTCVTTSCSLFKPSLGVTGLVRVGPTLSSSKSWCGP